MLFALVASPSGRGAAVLAFRGSVLHACTIRQASSVAARFMISKTSDEDYNAMTVAELREELRERGLAVSGIKAQLVERLASGEVNPKGVGNLPKKKKKKKEEETEKKKKVHNNEREEEGAYRDDGVDDLAGLIEQVKSMDTGSADATREQVGRRMASLSRISNNLVFASEGEEEGSDDEWDNAANDEWINDGN